VRVQIATPGCRVRNLVVVTTLLDAKTYSLEDRAVLYHQRWHVELDIRAIKATLQMEMLGCRTPFMLEKERSGATFLGYNPGWRQVSCLGGVGSGMQAAANSSFTAEYTSGAAGHVPGRACEARAPWAFGSVERGVAQGVLSIRRRWANRQDSLVNAGGETASRRVRALLTTPRAEAQGRGLARG